MKGDSCVYLCYDDDDNDADNDYSGVKSVVLRDTR